ncbi:hypothetical protein PsorP6_014123 [Peronosclerospora sorghi]|uniref:Uncharacterized protein n=1 Tax=Peronosclerospora sorghi TaxID=230839 RepID=A0ACC0VID1_9STRA|nr:hypothetical protein PsorP6_014123 [Peronosclerospora sorghi]
MPLLCLAAASRLLSPGTHDDDCTHGRAGGMLPVGAAEAPATIAAVSMKMDQGATWHTGSLLPPYHLPRPFLSGLRVRHTVRVEAGPLNMRSHVTSSKKP